MSGRAHVMVDPADRDSPTWWGPLLQATDEINTCARPGLQAPTANPRHRTSRPPLLFPHFNIYQRRFDRDYNHS